MSKMLTVCSKFSQEYEVIFNPEKSKHMSCSNKSNYPNVFIDNLPISKVNIFEHVCYTFGQNALEENVSYFIKWFQAEINILMAQCHISIRYKLFKTYCMPLDGSRLWDFVNRSLECFYIAWRKATTFIWRVAYRTQNMLLPLICCYIPV